MCMYINYNKTTFNTQMKTYINKKMPMSSKLLGNLSYILSFKKMINYLS